MRLFMVTVCIFTFLNHGCATRKYTSERLLRTVDTQTEVLSSVSRFELDLTCDHGDLIIAKVRKIRDDKVKIRHKKLLERCWRIERDKPPDNILELPVWLGVSIPFAILQKIIDNPRPGCENYTEWSGWEQTVVPRASETPYQTEVYLDCGPAGRYKLITDKMGKASLNVNSLLNRLTRDYSWTIKAEAHCSGVFVRDSLTLNTNQLGVNWDKPRYQPDFPPRLVASVKFIDPNKNQILDAKETAYLVVTLANKGRGEAFQIYFDAKMEGEVHGVALKPLDRLFIESMAQDESRELKFKLKAEEEVPAQRIRIKMSMKELNGFEPPPLEVNLATRPYAPPKLALARWALDDDNMGMSDGNGNGCLELGEQAEITLFIQNFGKGSAENVNINMEVKESNLFSKELMTDLGEIPPGEWRKAVFALRINNRYTGPANLPLFMKVRERRSKFGFQQKLELLLGKTIKQPEVVKIEGVQSEKVVPEIKPIPIFKTKKQNMFIKMGEGTKYALLIGINDYLDPELRHLNYAEQDIMELYKILASPELGGYNPVNVFLMIPKSERPQDRPTRDNILVTLKWLSENLKPQDSLIFAFSGHGDVDNKTNFLIPLDGRRVLPQDTSIRLLRLFEWLDACPAKRQVVMLDSCHSGGLSRGERGNRGSMELSRHFSKEIERRGKVEGRAFLSACSSDEVSYEDDNLGHGIFSYFVLKGLRDMDADLNKDYRVTVYELGSFVKHKVQDWCKYNRKSPTQTPRLIYKDTSGDIEIVRKK